MNYAGRFDATFSSEGLATHSQHAYVHVDSSQTHAPADALIVPDAQLLFHADYSRSGADLILSKDDHQFVLHDYFRGDKRVALASPDGAHLTADIVKALVGEVDVAQAGDAPAASHVIGHVTKLQGSATVIRNGVAVILNMGDNVEKGDVVQSGGNSTLGITFIDGTVFGLGANARMVLNDMVYDPHGSNNSSLLSLVAGTITFVAGETAKHGDMKVDTPVATMGIRGTAVLVEIDFDVPGQNGTPNASFQVLVEPDGTTGSYILFDKTTLQPIAIVNQAGQQININNGVVSQTTVPLSPDIQKLITDVFQQKFTDNSNTKTTSPTDDTITPQNGPIIKLANGTSAQPVNVVTNTADTAPTLPTTTLSTPISHIGGPPQLAIVSLQGVPTPAYSVAEIPGKTHDTADHDTVVFTARFNDINQGDSPTVSASFDHYSYKSALGQDVTASLSALQQADIAATAIRLALAPADGNSNIGTVSLTYTLADSNFDFLAAGEQLTLTYDVTVNNNYAPNPETRTVQVTITIIGTNDAPVITTAAPTITFAAGTGTPGGTLQTRNPTAGTLNFSDVDLTDTHTVSTRLAAAVMSNGGTIPPLPEKLFEHALSASIGIDSTGTGNGVIDWQLAPLPVYIADFIPKGQSVTLTYDVTVTDSQGATSDQTITVVITGTEAAAEVWIHTTSDGHDNLWTTGANWETGNAPSSTDDVIVITDQLHPNTPSYPVLIEKGTAAVANSVTMNDFAGLAPELDIASGASLTIGAGLNLSADSILDNAGSVTVGGKLELVDSVDPSGNPLLNESVIVNSGRLNLGQGGDIQGLAGITNTGTIDLQGGTLNVLVNIVNSGGDTNGQITVENAATLALGTDPNNSGVSGGITGGTVTIFGELDLQGSDFLASGTLLNNGRSSVSGVGNSLDGETVSNSGTIEVLANGALLLDLSTAITGEGKITVDALATLAMNGATIDGGTVTLDGLLNSTGTNAILDATINVDGTGTLESTGGVLTIDPALPATLTNAGTVEANGGELDITTELVTNLNTLKAINDGALKLTSTTVTNTGGTVSDDSGSTIELVGATIASGAVTLDGLLDSTGISAIHGATITVDSTGTLESTSEVLTIDATASSFTLTNSGIVKADGGEIDITAEPVTNKATLEAIDDGTLKLSSLTVTNTGTVWDDATSTIDMADATISGGKVIIDGLLESTGTNYITGATIDNVGNIHVSGGTLTIDPAPLTNIGTILVTNGSTLVLDGETINNSVTDPETRTTTDGTIQVDAAPGSISELNLQGSTINGGIISLSGVLDSTETSFINDAIVNYSGTFDVTSGSLTIDANSILHNAGTGIFDADGGNLIIDAAVSGSIDINGISMVELRAAEGRYSNATVAFASGSTGELVLDNAAAFLGAGGLTVSGLDDNKLDLRNVAYGSNLTAVYSGNALGGTLSVYQNGHDVADINLTGDYLGVHWVLANDGSAQGGTLISEAPGAIGGLNPQGNAVEGRQLTVFITDGGATVSDAHYDWQVWNASSKTWTEANGANGQSSYTPVEGDEGQLLQVVLTYTDATGHVETSTVSAGTVQESPTENASIQLTGLTAGNAVEGQQVTATVSEGDAPSSGITYTWMVNGVAVKTGVDALGNTYTPTENDEGKAIAVSVSFTDTHGFSESGTQSAGTVQESPTENASIQLTGLTAGNAVEGQQVTATVTEGDAPSSGVTYTWMVNGVAVKTGVDALGNTYIPTENDEGKAITVSVSFTDTHGFSESGSASAGTVQEQVGGDLVATLDHTTAQDGITIHVTQVTDGGNIVRQGISYQWQTSTDGGVTWTTVGTNSSFTPGDAQEGKPMQLVVSYTDATGTESVTYGLGVPTDLVATLDATTAQQGRSIHVTRVTDGGNSVSSGVSYAWQVSSDGHTWTTVGTGSSFTPIAGEVGDQLQVVVSYTESSEHESITKSLGVIAVGAGAPVVTLTAAATFTTLDDPGTSNSQPGGINDAGIIVGGSAADANHQIAWEYSDGTFIQIGASLSAQDVTGHAINNNDVIVGDYSPVRSTPRYGFIDNNGTFTRVASDSPGQSTNANGINDAGVVVGSDYLHSGARYTGYIYSGGSNGTFTYFNVPGTDNASGDTFANGINNEGQVVGSYNPNASNANGYHGFIYDSVHGTFTDISDPLGVNGTFASAINDHGQVVGWYVDANGRDHGFIESGGIYTTIDDPAGVKGTVVTGINNSDQIVGYTIDANGNTHGFETSYSTTVTAENTSLVLNSVDVSDAAAGRHSIEVQLAVGHGTLALNNSTGVSVSFDAGHDTMTLTGSTAAIDTVLTKGVVYTPENGFTGSDTLIVTANDEGHNSNGTPLTTTQTLGLTVDGGPVIETDKFVVTQNNDAEHTTTVAGLQVNDSDPSGQFTISVTTGDAPESTVTPDSGTDTLANINSLLNSGITYDPGTNSPQQDMVNLTVTDSHGVSDTVHFVFNQGGSDTGSVTLTGTTGNDVIFATGGPDTLTGNGGIDQFVFKPEDGGTNPVEHTVTDFDVNHDTIDLRQFSNIGSWTDVGIASVNGGHDTELTLDDHVKVLLQHVNASTLQASDFIVHPHV